MPSTVLTEWLRGCNGRSLNFNQDKADGKFVCLVSVTVRCRIESGRKAEQRFRIIERRQSVVTAVNCSAIVGGTKSDGLAVKILEAFIVIAKNAGAGQCGMTMPTK
ncbi:hypothetical protein MARLIPOL_14125 [Marinobacter lipolyticus SM19]|uniref:Uncharacterized protein n=1 Tax=Marinobacter lipolyticus SM19 TaxID=1318628 RepID=R8AY98_9GAMM|nr:hypothetical protein MARLIPOL_14125 [Marinobacter lipolyticus SM19]